MNLRVDAKLKNSAEKIANELGLPMSVAITLFLKAMVREKGLPFSVVVDSKKKLVSRVSYQPIVDIEDEEPNNDDDLKDQESIKNAIDKL